MKPPAVKQHYQISWEEAVSRGVELREAKDNVQWDLGDLAAEVETVYGTDALGKFANEIGINKKSLQQYRRVAQAYKEEQRIDFLSHRHHLILAAREDRLEWLEKAADNEWTTTQLHRELKIAEEGELPQDEKHPDTYRCPDCGGWRIETDKVCSCGWKYQLKEEELNND